ncbi:MAG: SRPBCC family protein [Solirubrobacteraceae bacterium]
MSGASVIGTTLRELERLFRMVQYRLYQLVRLLLSILLEVFAVKPVRVSVVIARPRPEVFAFLDVNANHPPFLDHMWTDFEFSGPERGVGSRLRARSLAPGPEDWTEIEVVETQAPRRIVERGAGAKGKRRTQGTYTLEERPDGDTEVTFELEFLAAPRSEKLAAPLLGPYTRRVLAQAMTRLRGQLEWATAPRAGALT